MPIFSKCFGDTTLYSESFGKTETLLAAVLLGGEEKVFFHHWFCRVRITGISGRNLTMRRIEPVEAG